MENKSKNIVCATDFSDASSPAVDMAVGFAKQLGAKLTLVHVVQVPSYLGWDDGPAMASVHDAYVAEIRKKAEEDLAQAAGQITSQTAGIEVETSVLDGVPHQVLADLSKEADMLVLGTHGRTGLEHLLIGSVAERTVRLSECPVLTVRPKRA